MRKDDMKRIAISYILTTTLLVAAGTVSAQVSTDAPNGTLLRQKTKKAQLPFSTKSTIDDYLEYAFKHNRAMQASQLRHLSVSELEHQVGWLPDPELSFQYMFEQHDMQYQINLTQKIPGFGKLGLKKDIAKAQAESAKYDSDTVRLMVFENMIKGFHNYHYLRRVTEVTDENITLLTELEKVLLNRYKASSAGYSDVLKVQVEKDRLLNQKEGLTDMRSLASARLCALLDLPTDTILPWPKATKSGPATLPGDVLMDMLEMLNPELKAMDATIDSLAMAADLAKKEYWPDFMIGAGYHLMPEPETGSTPTDTGVMLGITLPLWYGKNKSAVREASLARTASVHNRKQLENNLQLELKQALFDLRDSERQIALLTKSLIPKAQQAFDVARKEFTSGSTPFMTLIDAQRTLFDLSLTLERSKVDREIALGEIGCCVGKYDIKALEGKNTDDK
jgi:cobalt-zinc-cadmium efflux system outer membrane protein